MVTAVLCLLLAAGPAADEQMSILPDRPYRLQSLLHDIPALDSYHRLLETVIAPVVFQVEESGGFSDVDPSKFSIYGDSWVWNRWYLDGIDITDPYTSGAPAFFVPFALVDRLQLVYRESPGGARAQGIDLETSPRRRLGPRAKVQVGAPNAGGIWPLARPLMDVFSGKHARDRSQPPPEARRRYRDSFELSLADELAGANLDAQYALHVQRGRRQYLDFLSTEGDVETFDEGFVIASAAAVIRPRSGAWTGWLAAEYRARDHMFAELYHAREETAALSRGTLFGAVARGAFRAGLTVQRFSLTPTNPTFTRELLDPDGESRRPFFVGGDYTTASADLRYAPGPGYVQGTQHILHAAPSRERWSHAVTVAAAPYGRWDFESQATVWAYGDLRAGWADALELGSVRFSHDLYAFGTYGLNASLDNSLVLFDVGAKVALTARDPGDFAPFLTLSRTPVAVSPELVRTLDPRHLAGTFRLEDGRVLETQGGAWTRVDGPLSPTDVYSAGTGFSWRLADTVRLEAVGLFKAYRDTHQLRYDGDPTEYGHYADNGVFFLDPGPTRFRLESDAADTPLSYGLHLQLLWQDVGHHYFTVSFSAFNGIGRSPFGNGPTANDIGLVRFDDANPNARMLDLANLDADRGFLVKSVFGYRIWEGLWGLATVRFRDGQPFTFFDVHSEGGQVALTNHSKRGSPLTVSRPLLGPREDFHLNVDVALRYDLDVGDQRISTSLLATNLLDMGNEIQEVSGGAGIGGRAALETQIPRALFFSLELLGPEASSTTHQRASSAAGGASR